MPRSAAAPRPARVPVPRARAVEIGSRSLHTLPASCTPSSPYPLHMLVSSAYLISAAGLWAAAQILLQDHVGLPFRREHLVTRDLDDAVKAGLDPHPQC